MKVILKEDIKGTGKKGDLVEVSSGYGRNYLLKLNKAILATPSAINERNMKIKSSKHADELKKEQALLLKDKLNNVILNFNVKSADSGKIFGSVTSKEISEKLKEQNINVDKKDIIIESQIKNTGIYKIKLKLYKGIYGEVNINIQST